MSVSVGRLVKVADKQIRFVALVHNTIRGAAGCALLNAEAYDLLMG
jgi:aspartate-semialdehyde dehydrogenase